MDIIEQLAGQRDQQPSPAERAKRARVADGSRSAAEPSTMPAPTDNSGCGWRDWAGATMAGGPATLIAQRLLSADVADYVRFRAACSAWRRCTPDPRADVLDRRFHPHGWTMVHDVQHRGARRYFRFLNFSTGESIRTAIPWLDDDSTVIACTSQGLLVLLNIKNDGVCVVNPITGAHADLPPVTSLLSGGHLQDLLSPVWSDEVRAEVTDDGLVAINFGEYRLLGVARPGDVHWSEVEYEEWIGGIFWSAGRVYCFSDNTLMVLETSAHLPAPGLVNVLT